MTAFKNNKRLIFHEAQSLLMTLERAIAGKQLTTAQDLRLLLNPGHPARYAMEGNEPLLQRLSALTSSLEQLEHELAARQTRVEKLRTKWRSLAPKIATPCRA